MALTAITATLPVNGVKGPKQFQGIFDVIPFKVTLEDDTVAASLASQVDVAVPGAELGDFVFISAPVDLVAAVLTAAVLSAGNITITYQNNNDGAANTALATPVECKGFILKPKANVFESF